MATIPKTIFFRKDNKATRQRSYGIRQSGYGLG